MDNENEFNYSVDQKFKQTKPAKKSGGGFGKTVFVPFLAGIVGASLTVGVCFKVPEVRKVLIGEQPKTSYSAPRIENSKNSSDTNITADFMSFSKSSIQVAKTVLPSIVGIEIKYNVTSLFGNSEAKATGSGVIISEDGYIITNNHVVSTETSSSSFYTITEAKGLTVKLYGDDKEYEAEIYVTALPVFAFTTCSSSEEQLNGYQATKVVSDVFPIGRDAENESEGLKSLEVAKRKYKYVFTSEQEYKNVVGAKESEITFDNITGSAYYDDEALTLYIVTDLSMETLKSENNGEFPLLYSDFQQLYTSKNYTCSNGLSYSNK